MIHSVDRKSGLWNYDGSRIQLFLGWLWLDVLRRRWAGWMTCTAMAMAMAMMPDVLLLVILPLLRDR